MSKSGTPKVHQKWFIESGVHGVPTGPAHQCPRPGKPLQSPHLPKMNNAQHMEKSPTNKSRSSCHQKLQKHHQCPQDSCIPPAGCAASGPNIVSVNSAWRLSRASSSVVARSATAVAASGAASGPRYPSATSAS